jgi:hypothetical protein
VGTALHAPKRKLPWLGIGRAGWTADLPLDPSLLDDLVDLGEERLRYGEIEDLGGLEVNHQLGPLRSLDRQIAGFGAFEDLVHVTGGAAINIAHDSAVGDQAAALRESLPLINRRQPIIGSAINDLLALKKIDRIVRMMSRSAPLL